MTGLDFALLAVYLLATLGIGGLFYKRHSTSAEFLFAGRSVSWIPVAVSILATDFSAITFLGMPAFIYQRDMQSAPIVYMLPLVVIPLVRHYIAPFYHKLDVSTSYEFLERRFDLRVRAAASFIFLMMRGMYMGIVIYAPSLVISVVTGLPLFESILVMGVMTTIYTALGGMKAVIWTDFLQFIVIALGLGAILAIGAGGVEGGWAGVWSTTSALGKTKMFDYAFDLRKEFTIWAVMIGATFMFLNTYGTDQVILQRYMSTRSLEECRRALKLEAFLFIPVMLSLQATGLVLAAYYHQHPAEAAGIPMRDAVLPYFTVYHLPTGLRGLVIASIFAAAMSTVSGGINSLTTATLVDFYKRHFRREETDTHYVTFSRMVTVFWGLTATVLALFANRLGELANAYNKVNSLIGGVMLGIFLSGMLSRRATPASVLAGAAAGFCAVFSASTYLGVAWLWQAPIGCITTFLVAHGTGSGRHALPTRHRG